MKPGRHGVRRGRAEAIGDHERGKEPPSANAGRQPSPASRPVLEGALGPLSLATRGLHRTDRGPDRREWRSATTDIARRYGRRPPDREQDHRSPEARGLARAKPYRGIFLTETGAAMARARRHRLVVDLLIAVGAPREAAEADAEGIEHYVSATTLSAFEAFLHGRGES